MPEGWKTCGTGLNPAEPQARKVNVVVVRQSVGSGYHTALLQPELTDTQGEAKTSVPGQREGGQEMVHVRFTPRISHQEVLSKHETVLLMHNSCESEQGCSLRVFPTLGSSWSPLLQPAPLCIFPFNFMSFSPKYKNHLLSQCPETILVTTLGYYLPVFSFSF